MPNISKSFARTAKCEEGKSKQEYYDNELKGFMLEVKSNNRKTYYLRITTKENKRQSIKIADATLLDADAARTKALKLKRSIEEGKDVIIDTPQPPTTVPTLECFYHEMYIPYVKHYSKSWDKNASTFMIHILPDLGKYPMDKITPPMIAKCHVAMIEKKRLSNSSANKYIVFLRHAYNLAQEWKLEGIIDNPATKVKLYEERSRERFITPKEAKKLLYAVKQSNNPHLKYIVTFLILTGARRSEVLRSEWVDIDFTNRIWTIPITKNKKVRKVPISDALMELLQSIPKESKYLFPTNTKLGHYKDIYRTWDIARRKAGLSDVRLHDLRHSFASILVNSGRSLYEVQTLLGHSSIKMTQRYAHLSDESLHKAVSCAGKLLR